MSCRLERKLRVLLIQTCRSAQTAALRTPLCSQNPPRPWPLSTGSRLGLANGKHWLDLEGRRKGKARALLRVSYVRGTALCLLRGSQSDACPHGPRSVRAAHVVCAQATAAPASGPRNTSFSLCPSSPRGGRCFFFILIFSWPCSPRSPVLCITPLPTPSPPDYLERSLSPWFNLDQCTRYLVFSTTFLSGRFLSFV